MFLFGCEDHWNIWLHGWIPDCVRRRGGRETHWEIPERSKLSKKAVRWKDKGITCPFFRKNHGGRSQGWEGCVVCQRRQVIYSHVEFPRTCLSNRDGKWITYTLEWHGSYGNACRTRRGGSFLSRSFLGAFLSRNKELLCQRRVARWR